MIGVSEFCKQPLVRTESICTIAPFWGDKICGVDILLRTVANVLLDGQKSNFGKKMQVFIHSIIEPTTF